MIIATRSSPLARWQAEAVSSLLAQRGVDVEFLFVATSGDKDQTRQIQDMAGQGVFVKEVQRAVLDGRADAAVHSAKDLRSTPTRGLNLVGFLERGDPRDALIGNHLDQIPEGGVVATGSARRRVQLMDLRPDLKFVGLRGNIKTRVSIAQGKEVDAQERKIIAPITGSIAKILVKNELRLELILSNISLNLDLVSESIFLIAFSNVETEDERSSYCSSKYFFLSF